MALAVAGTQDYARKLGASADAFGPRFRARAIVTSERFQILDRRQQYFDCTQHDHKRYDFDGRAVKVGVAGGLQQPLLSAEGQSWYVPLRERRPSSPYRLGKIIVEAYTNLIFGEERWPAVVVTGDEDGRDFCEALVDAADLRVKMVQARNWGGAVGSVGMSWRYADGRPRVDVHNAKNLYVHEWKDRSQLIPAHVSEIYRYPKDEYDPQLRTIRRNWYWYRHDWTMEAEIGFVPIQYRNDQDPTWVIDEESTIEHALGECPFVWIQNLPSDEIDGVCDYHALYDSLDAIDMLSSVLMRGTTLNLDPTLMLKMDPDIVNHVGVKKGTDNALVVGPDGDASYLELSGSSVEAGVKLFELKRRSTLEAAQCVIADPDQIAAQGISSVAIKAIYAPMLSGGSVRRSQYGAGIVRILDGLRRTAIKKGGETIVVVGDDGSEEEATPYVDLPPRIEEVDELDPVTQLPTGAKVQTLVERTPGSGGSIEFKWPAWFKPTPTDQQATVTTLQMATGGKSFMSVQSATEEAAAVFGRDPAQEWERVHKGAQDAAAANAAMFADANGGMGGVVDPNDPEAGVVVPGAEGADPSADPAADPAAAGGAPGEPAKKVELELTSTDIAAIVSVNEARQSQGLGVLLGVDGKPDPEGNLTITEFKATKAATIAAAAAAEKGMSKPQDGAAPPGGGFGGPPGGKPGGFGGPPGAKAALGDPPAKKGDDEEDVDPTVELTEEDDDELGPDGKPKKKKAPPPAKE